MEKKYDFVIVGAGFFGAICANELHKKKFKVLVIDKRDHIGGNCYTEIKDNINIHKYGPHIFHTSNKKIWEWINQFAEFNDFIFNPVANYKNEIYSLPFNMWTFSKLWKITHPEQAKEIILNQSKIIINEPQNLKEQAIKLVGLDVYKKLIKGYTEKQWRKKATDLPPEIISRLPVRFSYDGNYFNDKYQGIPIGGYTQIFEKLLEGIDLKLNCDYFSDKLPFYKFLIYTGPIDKYFNYKFGKLEYKTTKFEHLLLPISNYQGTAVMNFTEKKIPYTRIIEHKHFEKSETNKTWITKEYPTKYINDVTEPYYPVNDAINNYKYEQYKIETLKLKNIYFGGRLGNYKYYDMHNVIESALTFLNDLLCKI